MIIKNYYNLPLISVCKIHVVKYLRRIISSCTKLIIKLFRKYLKEFTSAVFNSLWVKDMNGIEGMQHRAVNMVMELRGMNYNLRLNKFRLISFLRR